MWHGCSRQEVSWTLIQTTTENISVYELIYAGPVSTEMGDCVRVQFPVADIYFGM